MANLLRLVASLFVLLSFNAFAVDTDGDGFSDADEATLGTDPNDPTSPLENKLTASDGAQSDYFGYSISIDGDTAVIGAYWGDGISTDSGSAYIFPLSQPHLNVPAMGGIGLLALGLSMLGLGVVRLSKK